MRLAGSRIRNEPLSFAVSITTMFQKITPGRISPTRGYLLVFALNLMTLVVDGGGYKAGAREWLQQHIDDNWLDYKAMGKKIQLMKIADFVNWFNHEFSA